VYASLLQSGSTSIRALLHDGQATTDLAPRSEAHQKHPLHIAKNVFAVALVMDCTRLLLAPPHLFASEHAYDAINVQLLRYSHSDWTGL
jgi:hypothetical protein